MVYFSQLLSSPQGVEATSHIRETLGVIKKAASTTVLSRPGSKEFVRKI